MLAIQIPPGRPDLLVLEGQLDFHTAPRLHGALAVKLAERHPKFHLDCAGLKFIDSRGIAVMVEYMRDAADFGGQLVILNPSPIVAEVLRIVRLEEHFHCGSQECATQGPAAGIAVTA